MTEQLVLGLRGPHCDYCGAPAIYLLGCGGWVEVDGRRVCQEHGREAALSTINAVRASHGAAPVEAWA